MHALVCELARPQGWFCLSVADGVGVRRIVGDRDYRYPRRWVGSGENRPHNPACDLDIGRRRCQLRIGRGLLGTEETPTG